MGYEIRRAGTISYAKQIYNDFLSGLNDKKMAFPEIFQDYEKYHEVVNTSMLFRAQLVEDWIDRNSTLLDVGVGDGVVAEYLSKKLNTVVYGLDISETACRKAQEKGIDSRVMDINYGLRLQNDEIYDYVLLMEVIEHTVQPEKVVKDAIKHARKGVIVTIPNSGYFRWRLHLLRGYTPRQSYTHLHFWSIKDFEIWCSLLGISIKSFKTILPPFLKPLKNLFAWQQCWLLDPDVNRPDNMS
jgi:methionine biosynthesis protein MetW